MLVVYINLTSFSKYGSAFLYNFVQLTFVLMRKIYSILLFFSLTIFPLAAIGYLKFESITTRDGLSHNTVRYIMQDKQGFIWISTVNGLNCYDGHKFISMHPEFKTPSLTENNIKHTIEDNNGCIWIHSTSKFVSCYNTHAESFVDYAGKGEERDYKKIAVFTNGDVWLWGTENGACRVHYVNNKTIPTLYDTHNIGTNAITFVLEDSSGQLWMGTDKGLIQITSKTIQYCDINQQAYNYHSAIELKDYIYFFTHNNIIIVFDKCRKIFLPSINISQCRMQEINHTATLDENKILIAGKQTSLILNTTSSKISEVKEFSNGEKRKEINVCIDNKKNCWIYNKTGNIWRYRKDTKRFEKFNLIPADIISVIDLERYDIYCDSRNITWITTFGNGLFALEETGVINHFTMSNSGLKTNYLLSVSEDREGNIWIGTENTGISKISLIKYNNKVFLPNPNKTSISDRTIRSIYEDSNNGDIWIGTKSGDVYVFGKELNRKHLFSIRQGAPYCITSDTVGNLWIGTKGNGICIIPKGEKALRIHASHLLTDDNKMGGNNIYSILCDRKGRMWVGTFGKGLFLCEQGLRDFRAVAFPDISNKQKQIRCMIQDNSGLIWAGGENGIVIFNPDSLLKSSRSFTWFHFDKNNPQSLNNNIVKTIFEDSRKQIWIGTSGGGVNLAVKDPATESIQFKHYTSEKGLINNMVQAILEDDQQNLWISTEEGISKFNPVNIFFENHNFLDTWESGSFCESSAYKRKNGELLFGSHNGMYIFNPTSFENPVYSFPVKLTGFSVNGVLVTPTSPESPLSRSITETQSIRLKNGQNSFSIEFSSLYFQSTHSNRYTYILENYDKEWNPITQYNIATYKNIPAGKYIFKVKSKNNPSISDNIETKLEISIIPPFWKSTEAIILYLIVCVAIGFLLTRLIFKMNKLHNEVEIEKQLTEFRLRFFTNISHEFRTPLTIIQGSIENMNSMNALPPALRKQIKTLDKSSSRLMRLIDQLLEFRKMQNNKMSLQVEYTDAVGLLQEIYLLFLETAKRKHIHLTFSSSQEAKIILLDKDKIEKIAFNLLSNAFKHTPENGHINMEICFDTTEELFILKVSDSGIGIPPEKQNELFVRFSQINYSSSGIGIGLHLTSELTNIHKGKIQYSQSKWGGACFTVSIPTATPIYELPNNIPPIPIALHSNLKENTEINDTTKEVAQKGIITPEYKILLIEDEEEICLFLEDQLKNSFTVFSASNGLTGWEIAVNEQPHLIVCDVKMPGMDGFEITQKLKSNFQTSHIPVILLTAYSSMEHQLKGINAGADSYITKPFSTKYLISRIIKLIEQREKLQYKFAHEPGAIQTTICTTDKDNEFITKIHLIIEKHLDNPNFSVDDFAQAVHMGRTLFYKKIKGITNLSPNEYIRIIRLKKAVGLLQSTQLNVSEIAYKVGFNDPDYFSKCFKEQFGKRPTEFKNGKV